MGAPSTAFTACPGAFNLATCGGNNGAAVCVDTSGGFGTSVECDLGRSSDANGSDAKFVSATTTLFRAYGYEGDGDAFCCEIPVMNGCNTNPINVTIIGTWNIDVIDLNDTVASLALNCSNTYVYGEDEDDTITGSNLTTNYDFLYGDQDADTIAGLAGDDTIDGGYGNDTLFGNAGSDTITGGQGNDAIKGGDGDDNLSGGDDDDAICGEWGSDTQYGGNGDDIVFGGVDDDVSNDGDLGTDYCENDPTTNGCENWISYCPI